MTVLNKIAHLQGRRDEVPNQELARELAASGNKTGIKEIAENLWNQDKNIQSDCLKVLYEIGYIRPELIADYVSDFLRLLKSRNNRLVWGSMIALSTVTDLKAQEIYQNLDLIYNAMKAGSVITIDNGIKILAKLAANDEEFSKLIFPQLLHHLRNCRPKEIPQHSESIFIAVNSKNKSDFVLTLKDRECLMTPPQLNRIKKLYKALGI